MKYEFYNQEESTNSNSNKDKITAALGTGVVLLAIGTGYIISNSENEPGTCDTVSAKYEDSGTDIANRALKDLDVPRDSINRIYAGQNISHEITKSTNNKSIMPGDKVTICINQSKTEITDITYDIATSKLQN